MSLLLARIDDRLIHQQVVDGCCGGLFGQRAILANDAIAADPKARALFGAAGTSGVVAEVVTLAGAKRRLDELQAAGELEITVLVTETPSDMLRLVKEGCPIRSVTVGGMHRSARRPQEIWAGFYLGGLEREALLELHRRGIHVVFQSVPGAESRDLSQLVAPGSPT